MKIRLEKVEIEIPREFVDTISEGLMRLKSFDAQVMASEGRARQSMMSGLIGAAFGILRESMVSRPKPSEASPAAPAADSEEEPSP